MIAAAQVRWLRGASLAAAALALVVQVVPHAVDIWRDEYARGGAWEPRVKAILDVSRVASRGGPYLSVPVGPRFEPVDRKVNDLGVSALGYAWGRVLGEPLRRRMLMAINLALLVAAVAAILAASPPVLPRLLASAVLLVTPLPVSAYRSPDPLATHASLTLLGIVIAAAMLRRWPLWCYPILGVVLFGVHKLRSAYALYAGAALLAVAALGAWRARSRAPLLRAAATLAVCLPLELLWQLPLAGRAADPRVTQQDTLGTHPIYIALLEGVGWSENRWGIKPSDPWVATLLAGRFGVDPVDVGTAESEQRARIVYFELLRADPLHLLGVYASRLPAAARDYFFGGTLGALLLLPMAPAALLSAWRRPHPADGLLLGSAALTCCLLFQTVVLDPRLLYAYPLQIASGLTLAFAAALLLDVRWSRATGSSTASPSETPPRSP